MENKNRGLVLSGGGARGAYQAGVLKALAEIYLELGEKNPFQILTGVSAGAINAAGLACHPDDFLGSAMRMAEIWSGLSSNQVFRTDAVSLGKIGLSWVGGLSLGGAIGSEANRALLDTTPLRDLLTKNIPFDNLPNKLKAKKLSALSVTALDYNTAWTLSFVESLDQSRGWEKPRKKSIFTKIGIEHVMASSAIPLLFPAVQVGDRYFADGCVRNQAPCSPAVHLGANKLVIIGVRRDKFDSETWKGAGPDPLYPSPMIDFTSLQGGQFTDGDGLSSKRNQVVKPPSVGKVANTIVNSVMLDGVEADVARLKRVNEFVSQVPGAKRGEFTYKVIPYVFISPSQDIGKIANRLSSKIPRLVRYLLKGLGPLEDASELISYLLFEPAFTKELVELGYQDGLKARSEILNLG